MNNPNSKQLIKHFKIDQLSDIIENNANVKPQISKQDKEYLLNNLGLVHTVLGDEDIDQFKSFIYDLNSMLLIWTILYSIDDTWNYDIPPELVKATIETGKRLSEAIKKIDSPLVVRNVEFEPIYTASLLVLEKYQINNLKITIYKDNVNMLMAALGKGKIFEV